MKRRDFSVTAASLAAAAAGSALGLPALAQGAPFKEGKDYAKLAKPVASTAAAGKVEVVEFFLVQLRPLQRVRAGVGHLDEKHGVQKRQRAARASGV